MSIIRLKTFGKIAIKNFQKSPDVGLRQTLDRRPLHAIHCRLLRVHGNSCSESGSDSDTHQVVRRAGQVHYFFPLPLSTGPLSYTSKRNHKKTTRKAVQIKEHREKEEDGGAKTRRKLEGQTEERFESGDVTAVVGQEKRQLRRQQWRAFKTQGGPHHKRPPPALPHGRIRQGPGRSSRQDGRSWL